MNAFLFSNGLETLELRMAAVSHTALKIAEWLSQNEQVAAVYHPAKLDDNSSLLEYFFSMSRQLRMDSVTHFR
jgi:cystathionine beta-lyase/cystathionine gamma-synthase